MEIIFQGNHDSTEAVERLMHVIQMFKERYHIHQFREIHLRLTLMDEHGDEVELIDSETQQAYRVFEVHQEKATLQTRPIAPYLRLVVDNT